MKKKYKDLIVSACIIGVCAFLYHDTYQIPPPRFEPLGSAFFPRFILLGIILLSLMLIVKELSWRRGRDGQEHDDSVKLQDITDPWSIGYTLGVIAIFGSYVLLISTTDLPYLLLTFLFMLGLGWLLTFFKIRALPLILITAVSVTVIIYLVFGRLLGTFFP